MADVRLTATNPEDSKVYPVACNSAGELKLEEPILVPGPKGDKGDPGEKGDPGDPFTGNFSGDVFFQGTIHSQPPGAYNITFEAENVTFGAVYASDQTLKLGNLAGSTYNVILSSTGTAEFAGDVIIGSRGSQWMIVESNGLAHLVEQTREAPLPGDQSEPQLRDIPGELSMVEEHLQKVMERLKMIPESGWEIWDGSNS